MTAVDAAAAARGHSSDRYRRSELAGFLRARREGLTPDEVGLPHETRRRRTPGLRREEVAVLANVGVTWYTWMEQARDISVSAEILASVAKVLRLTDAERDYLFDLAGQERPSDSTPEGPESVHVRELLDSIADRPAYCVDRYWTVLASNRLGEVVFGARAGENCLERFFVDEEVAERYPFREATAKMLISQFREQAARFAGDPEFGAMVDRLAAQSPVFEHLWKSYVVGVAPHLDLVFDHPEVGRMSFSANVLRPVVDDDRRIFVYHPKPHTPTASALASLAAE
ncbi:helix-turn-helix transcriptional regulator [Streptomyces sp. SID13031]|uniref:helix-turn-helix transcriptional regulator n=1 Tax=Streptomyces sp. SID13031 TaxID=2706046 RepID=UPI0013C5A23D|nr:helix-turn-helix transcriptional regulator [Streptomyces sp. SID13031]NEA35919.1 helix-turn-helix domain-containing protein [Streptomyces sp. SID13031]